MEDVESTGSNQNNGGLVYNHDGSTFLRGKIVWFSPDSQRDTKKESEFLKYGGIINSQHIKITKSEDGREPDIKIHTNGPTLRAYRYGEGELSSIRIEAGKVDLHSRNGQAIYINAEDSKSAAVFEVKGKNTRLTAQGTKVTSASEDHGDYAGSGVIAIVGNNETGQAKGRSHTTISDGAQVSVQAQESNHKSDSAFLHQVTSGKFTISGKGTKLTCEAETPNGNQTAVLRFRIWGNQTLDVSDGAILEVTRNRGRSSALRFTQHDENGLGSKIRISGGSKVQIYNQGKGDNTASDGGSNGGRQGIEFAYTSKRYGKKSGIYLDDENSSLYVKSDFGPALESGGSAFDIKANPQTAISLVGKSGSKDGGALKFQSGAPIKIVLNNPYFYEFANTRNRHDGGGSWIAEVNNAYLYGSPEFHATNISLQAWRRGWDLTGIAERNYDRMSFQLEGTEFGTVKSASNAAFEAYVKKKGGISEQFSKISGMALAAKLENLRQPTNADKRIYGQVTVPRKYDRNGPTDYQAPYSGEVWVTLRLYRLQFKKDVTAPIGDPSKNIADFNKTYDVKTYDKELPAMGLNEGWEALPPEQREKNDRGISQFGEPKTYGVFEWDLEKEFKEKGEDGFLWAGEFVEVINIRKSWQENPAPFDVITPKNNFRNKGRYVFNVMPVEVTPDVAQGHIDPVLDASTAQTTISDATKSIIMKSSAKSIRKHAAVVPIALYPYDEYVAGQGTNQREDITTGSSGESQVSFYPMLSVAGKTRTNPKPETISQYQQDSQKSQLDLYTYLSSDEVGTKTAELFAFSDWDADISSLKGDLPPTYQKLTDITTTDDANAFSDGGNGAHLYGLRMPAQEVTYHDVTFSPATKLNIESYCPTALETALTRADGGSLDSVDRNQSDLVSYRVKLTNPNIQTFSNQLLLGYAMTFKVEGSASIFSDFGFQLPDGVTAKVSENEKEITLTATDKVALGEYIDIPVAVAGKFKITVTAWGRTLQEKTFGMPRKSWDVSGESHNYADAGFKPGLAVPSRESEDYVTYYRKLSAKEVTQQVTPTERQKEGKVYLSIADGKLTIYYRQLKDASKVKVEVDGKALTEFSVAYSDVEQAKPLNLKIDGVRNIVKVSYKKADGTRGTVTWKNPKLTN